MGRVLAGVFIALSVIVGLFLIASLSSVGTATSQAASEQHDTMCVVAVAHVAGMIDHGTVDQFSTAARSAEHVCEHESAMIAMDAPSEKEPILKAHQKRMIAALDSIAQGLERVASGTEARNGSEVRQGLAQVTRSRKAWERNAKAVLDRAAPTK